MGTPSNPDIQRAVLGILDELTASTKGAQMAIRHEALSDEEVARQGALNRSWSGGRRALDDADFRARLERSIASLNSSTSSAALTRDEFLALTEPS